MSLSGRAYRLQNMLPQLVADVRLYPAEAGGRSTPIPPGWGCPCMVSKEEPLVGYDGWPLLGDQPIEPGEERRLGFVFLSPDGLEAVRKAGTFLLWERGFIGECRVVDLGSVPDEV